MIQSRIAQLEAELQMHNDFLEENGYAIKFDMWKDIKAGLTQEQVIENASTEDISYDDVASLENEV
jgi:hypothetical protein